MTDGDHPHFIRIHRLVAAHLLAGMPDQRRCEFAEKLLPCIGMSFMEPNISVHLIGAMYGA